MKYDMYGLSTPSIARTNVQLIALHFECPWPSRGKFMVGKVSQFTLQPVANTNHKFPVTGPRVFHVT